jgi:hypothetical protein
LWREFDGGGRLIFAVTICRLSCSTFALLRFVLLLEQVQLSDEIVKLFRVDAVENFFLYTPPDDDGLCIYEKGGKVDDEVDDDLA